MNIIKKFFYKNKDYFILTSFILFPFLFPKDSFARKSNSNFFSSRFSESASVAEPRVKESFSVEFNSITLVNKQKMIDSFSNESMVEIPIKNKKHSFQYAENLKQHLLIAQKSSVKPIFPKILKSPVEIKEIGINTNNPIVLVEEEVLNFHQSKFTNNLIDFTNLKKILILSQFFIIYTKLSCYNFGENKNPIFNDNFKKSQSKLLKLKILCPPIKHDFVICCLKNPFSIEIGTIGILKEIFSYPYANCQFKKNSFCFYTLKQQAILTKIALDAKGTGLIVSREFLIKNGFFPEFLTFLKN